MGTLSFPESILSKQATPNSEFAEIFVCVSNRGALPSRPPAGEQQQLRTRLDCISCPWASTHQRPQQPDQPLALVPEAAGPSLAPSSGGPGQPVHMHASRTCSCLHYLCAAAPASRLFHCRINDSSQGAAWIAPCSLASCCHRLDQAMVVCMAADQPASLPAVLCAVVCDRPPPQKAIFSCQVSCSCVLWALCFPAHSRYGVPLGVLLSFRCCDLRLPRGFPL